jgi:hypothetical protein
VRRDRTYQLALISSDGTSRLPLRNRFPALDLRSQIVYRVSPGGRWLAVGDDDGGLRLLDGARRSFSIAEAYTDFRFSPDGRWLAVAARPRKAPQPAELPWPSDELPPADQLLLVDLGAPVPVPRSLARLTGITYLEWSAAGVLLQRTVRERYATEELTLVSLAGAQRAVHSGGFDRFASAARGYRVLVLERDGILEYDLSQPDRFWRRIADNSDVERDVLRNIEMAADGSAALYVTVDKEKVDGNPDMFRLREHLFLVEGTSTPRRIEAQRVSSLWADDEGARFVWQDTAGMHLGGVTFTLARRDALTSVRFRRDARGFVAARGREVVTWSAAGQGEAVRWRDAQPDERLIGADSYAGGLVVWTERDDPGQAKPR